MTNKRAIETFIVSLPAQTTMPVTGTLVNSTTGSINLNNGQIGIINASAFGSVATNSFVDATPTLAEAPAIQFVQGTAQSAGMSTLTAKYPLSIRPYETTYPILGSRKDVTVTKQPFLLGRHNLVQVGAEEAATDKIIPEKNTIYQLYVEFSGTRHNIFTGSDESSNGLRANYVSPDFTTLGYSTVQQRSAIVTNIASQINMNSTAVSGFGGTRKGSEPVVALMMGEATATGATAVSGLAVGSVVPVVKLSGSVRSLVITEELLGSIQAAATASPALTHILTVDTTDVGTFTHGLGKALWIIGLDETTAYVDYIPQRKVFIRVSLPQGFNSNARNRVLENGREGQGYGAILNLYYKATQGQRKYLGQHNSDPVIEYPSPVDESGKYTQYTISYFDERQIDVSNVSVSPHKAIILVPFENTPGNANPLIATLDSTLNSWLTSTGNNTIITI